MCTLRCWTEENQALEISYLERRTQKILTILQYPIIVMDGDIVEKLIQ